MSDTSAAAASGIRRPCYLVLSAHDYRTPRRANIHFITDQLAQRWHHAVLLAALQPPVADEGRRALATR